MLRAQENCVGRRQLPLTQDHRSLFPGLTFILSSGFLFAHIPCNWSPAEGEVCPLNWNGFSQKVFFSNLVIHWRLLGTKINLIISATYLFLQSYPTSKLSEKWKNQRIFRPKPDNLKHFPLSALWHCTIDLPLWLPKTSWMTWCFNSVECKDFQKASPIFPQLCPLALHDWSSSQTDWKTTARSVSSGSSADHSLNVIFCKYRNKNNNKTSLAFCDIWKCSCYCE